MTDSPDARYGRILEGAHVAGYTFARVQDHLIQLLESGDWKVVGPGFSHPSDFMRSIDLTSWRIEDHAKLAEALKGADPEVSTRAIAEATGIPRRTLDKALAKAGGSKDPPAEHDDPSHESRDLNSGSNDPPDDSPAPAETPELPDGQYRCVTIDAPWPMEKIERKVRPKQGKHLDYPTMSIEEIEQVVGNVLRQQPACHVYLWVTQKFLPSGLRLLQAWDVKYQCAMTWVKNVGPTPFSWMYDTEHVLFGQRGSVRLREKGLRLSFQAKVDGHSRKPAIFYQRVIAASPGPRLAMFERGERDGFEVWGNEV